MFNDPLYFLLNFARNLLPDTFLALFSSWFAIFKPEYLDLAQLKNIAAFAVGIVGAAITYGYIRTENHQDPQPASPNWGKQALLIGLVGLFAGLLPVWLTGYSMISSEWPINARFALAAFPGAALLLTLLIELSISRRARLIFIAILAGLMISYQFRAADDFRQVWELRSKFYQQLAWRIPGLKPNTAIVLANQYLPDFDSSSPAVLATASDFSVGLSLNAIYSAQPDSNGRIPYWVTTYPEFSPEQGISKQPINLYASHATLEFSSDPSNLLVINFNPAQGECLRIIGPEYATYAKMPPEIKALAAYSNPQAILTSSQQNSDLLNSIIDTRSNSSWCYFYEKADLAAQKQDWKGVVDLWGQTRNLKLHAANGYENLVYIRALLQTGDWQAASDLTHDTKSLNQGIASALCSLWVPAGSGRQPSPEQLLVKTRTIQKLQCGN